VDADSDDLLGDPVLSRDDDNCNIGNVISPYDVNLMKTVKLRKEEGNTLLLLRYTVLGIVTRTSSHPRLNWGRYTVLTVVVG
jgi:hypothetical protein